MKRTVVVPLDGSAFAEEALPMGRLLARLTESELHLVHVMKAPTVSAFHPEDRLSLAGRIRDQALLYLEELATAARSDGDVDVSCALIDDERGVAPALSDYVARTGACWLVLTTHGAGGVSRLVMGSVADALSRTATTPMMLLRPWDVTGELAPGERRFRWILVPLDGSAEAETAIDPAVELARATGASLSLVRIVAPQGAGAPGEESAGSGAEAALYVEAVAARLRGRSVRAQSWVVANPDPASGILTAALERCADLIVMATHGRHGIERMVLGSVSDELLRRSTLPLVLVGPQGVEARSVKPVSAANGKGLGGIGRVVAG